MLYCVMMSQISSFFILRWKTDSEKELSHLRMSLPRYLLREFRADVVRPFRRRSLLSRSWQFQLFVVSFVPCDDLFLFTSLLHRPLHSFRQKVRVRSHKLVVDIVFTQFLCARVWQPCFKVINERFSLYRRVAAINTSGVIVYEYFRCGSLKFSISLVFFLHDSRATPLVIKLLKTLHFPVIHHARTERPFLETQSTKIIIVWLFTGYFSIELLLSNLSIFLFFRSAPPPPPLLHVNL